LAQKWSRFMPWFHTILSEFSRSPTLRGNRMFTLLPECSPQSKFISIDTTTLHDLLASVIPTHYDANNVYVPFPSRTKFQQDKARYWGYYFRLPRKNQSDDGGGRQKTFAYFVRTDGVSCHFTYTRTIRQYPTADSKTANHNTEQGQQDALDEDL